MDMIEEWKDIKGFEGSYQISNLGKVKSLERKIKNRNGYSIKKEYMMNPSITPDGYLEVKLCVDRKIKGKHIHVLIAEAFIPNPNNHPIVRHLNDIKNDNRIENLCWGTYSENSYDAERNGLFKTKGSDNGNSVLKEKDVLEIRELSKDFNTDKSLAYKFNVDRMTISRIRRRKTWKHI